jgi:hypothetical protein
VLDTRLVRHSDEDSSKFIIVNLSVAFSADIVTQAFIDAGLTHVAAIDDMMLVATGKVWLARKRRMSP